METFKLTREMIFEGRTIAGAWTRAQIESLGVKYPPKHGWIDRLVGIEVTAEQYQDFLRKREVRVRITETQRRYYERCKLRRTANPLEAGAGKEHFSKVIDFANL